MPGQTGIGAFASPRTPTSSGRAIVREWYWSGLQPKLAQAVAQGHADAGRASELHRLMTRLIESEPLQGPEAEGVMRADAGRA